MKKVVAGTALVASLLLFSSCGQSNKQAQQHKESIASSKKAVSISKAKSSSKKASSDLAEAQFEVDELFDEDTDHTKLFSEFVSVDEVESVKETVDDLPQSKGHTSLEKLISKAKSLAKAQNPTVTNPETKAEESSLAKYRSESTKKELASISNSDNNKHKTSNNSDNYAKKIMDLGVPTHATGVSYSGHTVTWTGFDAWKDYTHPELEKLIAFLETITYQQSPKYNQKSPTLVVKLSDGSQIAHENPGQNLIWDN
ncbi:toxin Cry1Ac domain D-VI-related protein [Lactiplantibacillus paraxiangfangensis]|uniref:toxin Cry1Ac domain D-VI-related protein n=1 Tax=Lactiplantibacillus paraxiangfangensis TaxID=3076224 RepID=UPI0030C76828